MKDKTGELIEQILEAYPAMVLVIGNGRCTWNLKLKYEQGAGVKETNYGTVSGGIEKLHAELVKEAQAKAKEATDFVRCLEGTMCAAKAEPSSTSCDPKEGG